MTMTADAHVSAVLRDLDGGKWVNHDTEVETGCGIVPYTVQGGQLRPRPAVGDRARAVPARPDPWQVMLSTDHPNGGSFLSYPKLIRLLMDRAFREDQMGRANQRAIQRTALLDGLDREYTLNEIAIITRAAPARRLGLRDKGHLGVGADADVTIYHDRADREEMFATPRYVIKGGELAVEDGDLRRADDGLLLSSSRRRSIPRSTACSSRCSATATRSRSSTTRSATRRCASPRGSWRRPREQLPARRRRGRRHVRRGVPDALRAAVITAATDGWALEAARSATGFATSVIGCKCEAAIERPL